VLRYVEDRFNSSHLSTLQAAFMNKKITVRGKKVNLSIWDTAGQERFHALGPIYYRDSHGAVLVYDITDEDSFQKVKTWVRELKKMLGSEICLVIAGNKIDLEKKRNVNAKMAEEYAASVGAQHIHTSAKTKEGIDKLFTTLSEMILENAEKKMPENRTRKNVRIVDDTADKPKSGCCSSS